MITKEDFEKAEKVINDYKVQLNKALVISRICVCCRTKKIEPLEGMGLAEGQIKATEQEQGCWNHGTVEKVTFGYGSRNDMRGFYIAICDDCIEQLEKDGLAVDIKMLRKEERKYGL